MAILAFAAAGAALAPAGYAGIGWTIGAVVGQALFPGRLPDVTGPRIADLKAPASNYGAPIPKLYGTVRTAGIIVWSTDRIETATRTRQGGKGGPSQTSTTFSYRMSLAVKFGKGPAVGVRKIWANGRLIYNSSSNADAATIAASNVLAPGLTFYPGLESADPDPTMEAYLGVGNVPAFRDDICLVLTDFQLADYGNNPPVITAELVMEGSIGSSQSYATPAAVAGITQYRDIDTDGATIIALDFGAPARVSRSTDGQVWLPMETPPNFGNGFCIRFLGGVWIILQTNGFSWSSDGIQWNGVTTSEGAITGGVSVAYSGARYVAIGPNATWSTSSNGRIWTTQPVPVVKAWREVVWTGSQFVVVAEDGTVARSSDGFVWTVSAIGFGSTWASLATSGSDLIAVQSGSATAARSTNNGETWSSFSMPASGYNRVRWSAGQYVAVRGGLTNAYARSLNGTTWQSFAQAENWTMLSLCANGSLFFVVNGQITPNHRVITLRFDIVEPAAVPLQDVVSDLCSSAGLEPADYDVSALIDNVDGYAVARQMSARQAIEPLLQGYYVDAAESNGKIRFVPRGGAVALTVDAGDLAAHVVGDQPPDPIEIVRQQEVELPAVVDVGYINREADYEQSVQRAVRTTVRSQVQRDVELPLVLTDDKAREVAEVLIGDAWTQRTRFAVQLPANYAVLQPTDIIDVPGDSVTHRMRIERIVESRARVLRVEGPAEEISVYSQAVTGGAGLIASGQVRGVPNTLLQLLDIPLLRDQDDGLNVYAAAAGVSPGFRGAVVYRSADGGGSYDDIGAIVEESAIGYAANVLAAGTTGGFWFDTSNTVTVVMRSGELSSASEEALGGGANYLLVGDEILQFRTAELVATSTYRLSNLLRGRRGTEWAMSTHVVFERVVLLTPAGLSRFSAELSALRLYKPVSIGQTVQETLEQSFTNTGVNVKPFAPAHLRGWRNAARDLIVAFDRRSRTGVGLPLFIDPPLAETNQRYDVEVWNSTFSVLRRTYSAITTPTVTYTIAQQTSDSGGVQAAYGLRAFQLSTTVGRGYALQGVL